MEEDTIDHIRELKISADSAEGSPMRGELRNRVRRVVVGYCHNPEVHLARILSFPNLEELEINWYELAKKEHLIKIMNNLPNLRSLVLNCANEFDE
jgi:hypothetical protein